MAKKSMRAREDKRMKLVSQYDEKRTALKKQIKKTNSFQEQLDIQEKLQNLPRNSAPSRLRNRCWMTGRSRGVYRDFGLSRHVLREMAHECLLPGVTKSSW
jgi:small subunit ribosomal protein S14|uniref:Small ribosomal subunit protein uS14c n=1 Tax=Palmaria decipiens TaxID=187399 RepID=A0A6C0W281_PALDE|nr:30S ribosomal protein S14 [Palmaria decipiens]QIC19543.1 30S ribosomal protein S14 [Palmaria decipiens]